MSWKLLLDDEELHNNRQTAVCIATINNVMTNMMHWCAFAAVTFLVKARLYVWKLNYIELVMRSHLNIGRNT